MANGDKLMKASINIPLALALGVLLTACGGGGSSTTTTTSGNDNGSSSSTTSTGGNDNDNGGSTTTTGTNTGTTTGSTAPAVNAPDGARLLAAQCFQCHGTGGQSNSGIEGIAGDSAAGLVNEMLEMKYSTNVNDIMHRQAMGYSEDQIRAIATYIAGLPKGANGGND
jgi:cytochrome c553